MKRKICVVTGTRAEYGLIAALMKSVADQAEFTLQLVVTGMHLSPEFGLTYREIEQDGFTIDRAVEMLLSSDTPCGIAKSVGLGVIGFADVFAQLKPDLLILYGDRFEILAAAQTALFAKIPVAHIAGGDLTQGAFDDAIRHSITKMSHLHFVTTKDAFEIVRQLGENPENIHVVGSAAAERIAALPKMSRSELSSALPFHFREKNLLVTFHPVTLDTQASGKQFRELAEALASLGENVGLIFTKPNADPQGREIICLLDDFAAHHENAATFTSLGQQKYFSLIRQVDAVVGNSSSGLYEVPSFHKPTVNIGDRQKGRLLASSVICCPPKREEIKKAIEKAFDLDCSKAVNPYDSGGGAAKIVDVIRSIPDYRVLLKKQFYRL